MQDLPEYDSELQETYWQKQRTAMDGIREMKRAVMRAEHSQYLLSPKWKGLRAAALRRDRYICQGCLQARAVEVHHLTYDHWGDELLFELVSLCETCHEKVHESKS